MSKNKDIIIDIDDKVIDIDEEVKENHEADTEVEKYLNDLVVFMNESIKSQDLSIEVASIYRNFAQHCTELVNTIETYKNKGILTNDDKMKVLSAYQEVSLDTTNLLNYRGKSVNNGRPMKDMDEMLIGIGSSIDCFLSKDIKAIALMKDGDSLKDAIIKGRTKIIDVTNQKQFFVGGNSNTRRIIDMGDGKKGVFTAKTPFEPDKQLDDFVENMTKKFPEFSHTIKRVKTFASGDFKKYSNMCKPYFEKFEKYIFIEYDKAKLRSFVTEIASEKYVGGLGNEIKIKEDLKIFDELLGNVNQDYLKGFMYEFFSGLEMLGNTKKLNQDLMGSKKGDYLEEKNSAMTVIASLLGMDDVIAHSENVVVSNGGVVTEGCVMDFVEGKDMLNLPDSDPMIKYGLDAYDTPEAKRQISNLQILDLICGNIDRHLGNILYKFEDTDKGPRLKKITGIDNDLSFPSNDITFNKDDGGVDYRSALIAVDQDTAEKISAITPSMIRMALQGFGLSKEAVYFTTKRFGDIRSAIINHGKVRNKDGQFAVNSKAKKVRDNSVNIIPKDEWDNVPFSIMHTLNNETIAGRIKNDRLGYISKGIESFRKEKNKIFQKNNMYSIVNNLQRESKNLVGKLNGTYNFFRGSSKEFNQVVETLKKFDNKKGVPYHLKENDIQKFEKLFNDVDSQIDIYLSKKQEEKNQLAQKGKVLSDYANKRITAMTEVKKTLVSLYNEYNAGFNKWKEMNNDFIPQKQKDNIVLNGKEDDEKVFSKEDNEEIMKMMRNDGTEKSKKIDDVQKGDININISINKDN